MIYISMKAKDIARQYLAADYSFYDESTLCICCSSLSL